MKIIARNFKKKIRNRYLEIYITDDGNLAVTPLNKEAALVIKKVLGAKNHLDCIYCG